MPTSDNSNRRPGEQSYTGSTLTCPECGGRVHPENGETVCSGCGLVLDDQPIDRGPEWRSFGDDNGERERTGAPLTPARHDRGLSTVIGLGSDANGNSLSGKKRRQLGRLRREQSRGRWRSKAERNLGKGLSETRRIVSALGLPDSIRDQACTVFRSASDEDLLMGRSIESIASASVYASCRCNGLPRSLEEVAAVSRVGVGAIENGYTVLNRELGLPARPPKPSAYIPRFASELDLPEQVRRRALELAKAGHEISGGSGVHPGGLAAACIYLASKELGCGLTQGEVADVGGVSRATIRSHRDRLAEAMVDE